MFDFSKRSRLLERMDDPSVDKTEVLQALHELEVINQYLGGYAVILNAMDTIEKKDTIASIMDLGCGGGDTIRVLARRSEKNASNLKLTGIDINPVMTAYAASKSTNLPTVTFKTLNIWDDILLNEKADITMNSLFCHHFDDADLARLLVRMHQLCNKYVVINDLHRHWLACYLIKYITAFFSKTYLVKYDAPLSVARSLTRQEWVSMLEQAGLKKYSIKWMWAWRWQIIIPKQ